VLDLSPTKLIIIFVVVVVLLGPKRLPEVARQLGAWWRKLRDLHGQLDRELRQTMPDLPSSQDIVRFARSPITLLNQLADQPGQSAFSGPPADGVSQDGAEADAEPDGPTPTRVPSNGAGHTGPGEGGGPRVSFPSTRSVPSLAGLDADDPNLN
jgi:sec-independent protein translocase protein TatB